MPGIVQSATNHTLEIEVSGTGTLSVEHQVSGVEQTGAANPVPVSQQATVTGAGTTTASAAPAASTQRTVQSISAVNDGTQPVTVKYKKDVGGTEFALTPPYALDPQWSIQYTQDMGFRVFNALGAEICMAGYALLKAPTLLVAGTTFTPSIGCAAILIELWGAGAAGGSAAGAAGPLPGGAGGGSAGGYVRKFIIGVPASIAYVIGTGGTAAAAGNNAGNPGTATTMTVNGVVYSATGGLGGAGMASAASVAEAAGGASVSGSNGDENNNGEAGMPGGRYSATVVWGGAGGDSPLGSGGSQKIQTAGTGNAATGRAAGGGGGLATTANQQGGAGTGGAIRVWEFAAA